EELRLLGPGVGALAPVLKGHLEGDLDGGGPVVGEEDVGQPGGRQLDQPAGQEDGGNVGQAQQGGVGDPVELGAEGLVQLGDAVAVDVAPEGGDAVEVLVAVEVDEEAAGGLCDDEGPLGGVVLHGGEGVPDVGLVPLFELLAGGLHDAVPYAQST